MTNKRCMVFETLGKVSDLQVMECANPKEVRLSGVFGVCGLKNQNNRIYDKDNYAKMVESLQNVIKTEGCPGELEHPNSMNINLENVSHKIESIQMNEDGTITGTILLLNTPKGQIAKAIVEGGLPLYISSRGAGTITNEGLVTLSTIKTYDLVGTPGFAQAKLSLKENQTLECLNESLSDGNVVYAIVESDEDDLLGGSDKKESDDKKDKSDKSNKEKSDKKESDDKEEKKDKSDKKESDDKKEKDSSSDDKKEDTTDNYSDDNNDDNKDNKKDNKNVTMNDIKNAINELTDKVTHLEAELHIAQESLEDTQNRIKPVDYNAIEKWVKEEFATSFKKHILESVETSNSDLSKIVDTKVEAATNKIVESVKNWVINDFGNSVQTWITEEFAPHANKELIEGLAPAIEGWITNEYSPTIQNWITEEYSPTIQNWITEEYSEAINNWITEEYTSTLDTWLNEEFAPEQERLIKESVNQDVAQFVESQRTGRLDEIDSLLESIESNENVVEQIVKEEKNANKFKGVYVVENMPAEYKPSWEMLSEAKQNEIIRSSKMYDFTKDGVLETFWSNVKFEEEKQVTEHKNDEIQSDYHNKIVSEMYRLRK